MNTNELIKILELYPISSKEEYSKLLKLDKVALNYLLKLDDKLIKSTLEVILDMKDSEIEKIESSQIDKISIINNFLTTYNERYRKLIITNIMYKDVLYYEMNDAENDCFFTRRITETLNHLKRIYSLDDFESYNSYYSKIDEITRSFPWEFRMELKKRIISLLPLENEDSLYNSQKNLYFVKVNNMLYNFLNNQKKYGEAKRIVKVLDDLATIPSLEDKISIIDEISKVLNSINLLSFEMTFHIAERLTKLGKYNTKYSKELRNIFMELASINPYEDTTSLGLDDELLLHVLSKEQPEKLLKVYLSVIEKTPIAFMMNSQKLQKYFSKINSLLAAGKSSVSALNYIDSLMLKLENSPKKLEKEIEKTVLIESFNFDEIVKAKLLENKLFNKYSFKELKGLFEFMEEILLNVNNKEETIDLYLNILAKMQEQKIIGKELEAINKQLLSIIKENKTSTVLKIYLNSNLTLSKKTLKEVSNLEYVLTLEPTNSKLLDSYRLFITNENSINSKYYLKISEFLANIMFENTISSLSFKKITELFEDNSVLNVEEDCLEMIFDQITYLLKLANYIDKEAYLDSYLKMLDSYILKNNTALIVNNKKDSLTKNYLETIKVILEKIPKNTERQETLENITNLINNSSKLLTLSEITKRVAVDHLLILSDLEEEFTKQYINYFLNQSPDDDLTEVDIFVKDAVSYRDYDKTMIIRYIKEQLDIFNNTIDFPTFNINLFVNQFEEIILKDNGNEDTPKFINYILDSYKKIDRNSDNDYKEMSILRQMMIVYSSTEDFDIAYKSGQVLKYLIDDEENFTTIIEQQLTMLDINTPSLEIYLQAAENKQLASSENYLIVLNTLVEIAQKEDLDFLENSYYVLTDPKTFINQETLLSVITKLNQQEDTLVVLEEDEKDLVVSLEDVLTMDIPTSEKIKTLRLLPKKLELTKETKVKTKIYPQK